MTIRTTACDGHGRIVVEGELIDPPQASELYEAIRAAAELGASVVEIELSGVDLFGSVGINALLQGRQLAEPLGCTVAVVAASAIVRRVLEITCLTELLVLDQG